MAIQIVNNTPPPVSTAPLINAAVIDYGPLNLTATQSGMTLVLSPLPGFGNAASVAQGGYASISGASLPPTFATAANPFTVRFRAAMTAGGSATGVMFSRYRTAGNQTHCSFDIGLVNGALNFQFWTAGGVYAQIPYFGAIADAAMHAIAVCYDGTTIRGYLDGTMGGSLASTGLSTPTDTQAARPFTINGNDNPGLAPVGGVNQAWVIDNLEISTIARYTGASYAVQTVPHVADASTIGLFSFDDAAGGGGGGTSAPALTLTAVRTAATVAAAGQRVVCNTAGAGFPVTLPPATLSAEVGIVNVSTSGTNPATVTVNAGDAIAGPGATTGTTALPGESLDLLCCNTGVWSLI